MVDHGTSSMISDQDIDGSYITFQSDVLRQLPRPNEIPPAMRHAWHTGQDALRNVLRNSLVLGETEVKTPYLPSGKVIVSAIELERLEFIERRYTDLCEQLGMKSALEEMADVPIGDIFNREHYKELGLATNSLNNFLNRCRDEGIETISQLVATTEAEWLRTVFMGRKGVDIVKMVLAHHGLRLGMTIPAKRKEQ